MIENENTEFHRTHWRVEIDLPEYAEKYIRKRCKEYPLINRQNAWKEYLIQMLSFSLNYHFSNFDFHVDYG